jgi:hypothetical protein
MFVLTPEGKTLIHEIDGLQCEFEWTLVGSDLEIANDQTCNKFSDGKGGTLTLDATAGTRSIDAGGTMQVDVSGTIGGCPFTEISTAKKEQQCLHSKSIETWQW